MDIDPTQDYIEFGITKDGLILLYKSVCFHYDKWPGNNADPMEQMALAQMKDNLLRILLEQQFQKP